MEEQVVIDEEHHEVHGKILELLATRVKKIPIPFTFFKEKGEHTLAISSRIAQEVGLGFKTVIIKAQNPWSVYSSLALLIINSSTGAGI